LGQSGIKIKEEIMAETTFDSTKGKKIDYKTEVAVGLKEIEVRLENIERNQGETDKLKAETRIIAKRLDDLLEAM
jgi:hypothetical protein